MLTAVAAVAVFMLLSGDEVHCLDRGKIYDPVRKICRDDCLTWDENKGCVPVTAENIRLKETGRL